MLVDTPVSTLENENIRSTVVNNKLLAYAARDIQLLCSATNIHLDPPKFASQYVSFELKNLHQLDVDFFIRAQSVGIQCKNQERSLFYLLQRKIHYKELSFKVKQGGIQKTFPPYIAADGTSTIDNPQSFYLHGISSGNLNGWTDILVSRDSKTFEQRAGFLANLLFTQWIVPMMPIIQEYKDYKFAGLLKPIE